MPDFDAWDPDAFLEMAFEDANGCAIEPFDDDYEACRRCADPVDDGEGWDGLCGHCADEAERDRLEDEEAAHDAEVDRQIAEHEQWLADTSPE